MAELVPHAVFVIVPGSGHMTPLERPEVVSDALRAWMTAEVRELPGTPYA